MIGVCILCELFDQIDVGNWEDQMIIKPQVIEKEKFIVI